MKRVLILVVLINFAVALDYQYYLGRNLTIYKALLFCEKFKNGAIFTVRNAEEKAKLQDLMNQFQVEHVWTGGRHPLNKPWNSNDYFWWNTIQPVSEEQLSARQKYKLCIMAHAYPNPEFLTTERCMEQVNVICYTTRK